MKFENRFQAGKLLAEKLAVFSSIEPVVLALPRGGIPVAYQIAERLNAPLDVCLVKKIQAPGSPEFAIGAVAEDERPQLNESYIHHNRLNRDHIAEIVTERISEIRKKVKMYRQKVKKISLKDKAVIVVDDGLATGASMKAAVTWLRSQEVKKIIVAVPIASSDGENDLKKICDEFISLVTSEHMWAVGLWYDDFEQVSDAEALHLLEKSEKKTKNKDQSTGERSLEAKPSLPKLGPVEEVNHYAKSFKTLGDLDELVKNMSKHRIVMLGEATHGTKEFYEIRREISQKLMADYDFTFVAVEGDWPDCFKLNEAIKNKDIKVKDALKKSFHRWPTWMWANEEIPSLIEWMGKENKGAFYGLDVYSLFESLEVIKESSSLFEKEVSQKLLEAYNCFNEFSGDEIKYAESLLKIPQGCRGEIISSLREILRIRLKENQLSKNKLFDIQQNARVISNAESYYRTMLSGGVDSWNIRDNHMLETLERLLHFHGPKSKAIVWAHNTHIGDYHATDMLEEGHINLGGIAREAFGVENVYLLGLSSYCGEVTAGKAWGAQSETMPLPNALSGSWEEYFHKNSLSVHSDKLFVNLREVDKNSLFHQKIPHRAVGVVYNPNLEKYGSNYVPTKLAQRYDGFIFIDKTSALTPVSSTTVWGEFPETYPFGQ